MAPGRAAMQKGVPGMVDGTCRAVAAVLLLALAFSPLGGTTPQVRDPVLTREVRPEPKG